VKIMHALFPKLHLIFNLVEHLHVTLEG